MSTKHLRPGIAARVTARPNPMFAAFAACAIFVVAPAGAEGQGNGPDKPLEQESATGHLTVPLGQAEVVRYSREPGTVIIGDPAVAAASIAASDVLVLTGLQAGETNLIVLDDGGVQIDRMTLRVVEPGDTIVVRRGLDRQVVRCRPLCSPTDASGFAPSGSSFPRASEAPDPGAAVDTVARSQE